MFATREMKASLAVETLDQQRENLRIAARLLQKRVEGARVRHDDAGEVREITLSTWPSFADAVSPDHDFIDYVTQLTGETATIFAWDPERRDFVRRTTNIRRDDGTRAVGTVLGETSAAYAPMMAGEPFLGTALILGVPYEALYQPILAAGSALPANEEGVAGILYVGIQNAELASRMSHTVVGLWLAGTVFLVLGTAAVAFVCYALLAPLRRAVATIGALADGRKVDVSVTRRDELGAMQSALVRLAAAAERAFENVQVLEQSSQAILTAAAEDDMRIGFANRAARDLFGDLAGSDHRLPATLAGAPLADLDPAGEDLSAVAGDPGRLPHTRIVRFGKEVVVYALSPITRRDGGFAGVALSATSATRQELTATQFENDVASLLSRVEEALTSLKTRTDVLEETATAGTRDSAEAADLATRTSEAIQTVAAAVEELNGSFAEVAERIGTNAAMAREAAAATAGASASARALEEAGKRISEVVSLIADVAGQTNLLALNATIEASRAGEAGKGFAVVASEVKNLAERAATATSEITAEVQHVNAAGLDLLKAVENVGNAIRSVDEVSTAVSAAVEQQRVTTDEIARTVGGVADSASRVEHLARNVNASSARTGEAADEVADVTMTLQRTNRDLRDRAGRFLDFVREAA